MSKIFITGSSDGLGLLTAKSLCSQGHKVYLHARSPQRASEAHTSCPQAQSVLIADLTSTTETQHLADELSSLGPWDAIIHNAGLYVGAENKKGKEGIPALFAVNTLAPYMLSCLITPPPKRMVFVSSQLHQGGEPGNLMAECRYGDSKLHNIMLAMAFARKYAGTSKCNSLDPGWVATKMGGRSAPDDIGMAVETYVMLATDQRGETGKHWYQCKERGVKDVAGDVKRQEELVGELARISGVEVPGR